MYDPLPRCPDISMTKHELNWEPPVNLDSGLAKTINYFDQLLSTNDSNRG